MRRLVVLAMLAAGACTAHRAPKDATHRAPKDATRDADAPALVESNGGVYVVSWRSEPAPMPLDEPFDLVVNVRRKDGMAAELALAVDAVMPLHQHGMNVAPDIHALGQGEFRAEGMLLHMAGDWVIHFDVSEGALTERAQVAVRR